MSGGAISWLSKKQPVVALSTTEAEYVALGAATQRLFGQGDYYWISKPHQKCQLSSVKVLLLLQEIQCIMHVQNTFDIKYHYVCEALTNGVIDLVYCPTQQMTADILTKPLSYDRFELLWHEMGLKDLLQ